VPTGRFLDLDLLSFNQYLISKNSFSNLFKNEILPRIAPSYSHEISWKLGTFVWTLLGCVAPGGVPDVDVSIFS
jgi:hypothetical protein